MNRTGKDTDKIMIDPALVQRAMQWDQDAFRQLYEATYYRVRYVALKYMKDETAADDVTQEAYIRIWNHLPSLGNPESFVSWCSRIVANTALNELRKNQPMLFSDMQQEGEDGSEFGNDIEDTYLPNQPELNFTQQEEQQIIREMIDSLSDEQRICILMYYIEGLSVREIAETLGCSEGTVKSRLNYGRQNIKAKAEEMQRKGYNFSGISGLAVLLLLLGAEAVRMWARPVAVSSASAMAGGAAVGSAGGAVYGGAGASAPTGSAVAVQAGVSPNMAHASANMHVANATTGGSPAASSGSTGHGMSGGNAVPTESGAVKGAAAKTAGAKAAGAKAAFLSTAAGKAIVGIAIAIVLTVVGTVVAVNVKKDKKEETTEKNVAVIETETEEYAVTEEVSEAVTETVTDVATEAETEETTEEAASPDYAAEYARVLEENKDGISGFQEYYGTFVQASYSPITYPVAIVDAFGDETPELFFWARGEEQYSEAGLYIYTMENGKAVQKYKGIHLPIAGAANEHDIYLSQKKDGVYAVFDINSPSARAETTTYIQWNGSELIETQVDPASAELGEEIFGWDLDYPDALTIEDAQTKLALLDSRTPDERNKEAHAMGDALLKEYKEALTLNATSGDDSGLAAFDAKYNVYYNTSFSTSPEDVEYAYVDLNDDGVDELVLSGLTFGLFAFQSGRPVAIYNLGYQSVTSWYRVLENRHIALYYKGMAPLSYHEYELNETLTGMNEVRSEYFDIYDPQSEEVKAFEASVPAEMKLDYRKLSDLP